MAPAPSKLARTQTQPQQSSSRKRTSSKVTSAKSNATAKCLKPSTKITQHRPRQPSVEDVDDESDLLVNNSPKNPAILLEAADGIDDDVEMVDNDPAPQLEDFEDEDGDEEPKQSKAKETDEEQLRELNIFATPNHKPDFEFPIRTSFRRLGVSHLCIFSGDPYNHTY